MQTLVVKSVVQDSWGVEVGGRASSGASISVRDSSVNNAAATKPESRLGFFTSGERTRFHYGRQLRLLLALHY